MARAINDPPIRFGESIRLLGEAMTACRRMPVPAQLAAEPVRIRIRTALTWPAHALAGEFAPYLLPDPRPESPADDTSDTADVAVVIDSDLSRRLHELAGAKTTSAGRQDRFQVTDGLNVAEKPAAPGTRSTAYLVWRHDEVDVSYVVLADDGPVSRRMLFRIVRAIVARRLIAAGWVPLHAACAVTPAGGACLVGGRGSGKTTALLHLLAAGHGDTGFLANDTVFVAAQPDGVHVRGLPIAIGIRPTTIRMFPVLRELTGAVGQDARDGYVASAGGGSKVDNRLSITPNQLASAFGVPLVPQAQLAVIAGIRYVHAMRASGSWPCWKPLAVSAARYICGAAYLEELLPDDPHEAARLGTDADVLRREHQRLLDTVAAEVPVGLLQTTSHPRTGIRLRHALDNVLS